MNEFLFGNLQIGDLIDYAAINLTEIPSVIYNYRDEKPKAPFIYSIKILKCKLEAFEPEIDAHIFYKNLYMLLANYYLRDRRDFYFYFKKLINDQRRTPFQRLILYLKYDFELLDNILLFVAVDYEMNNNYFALKEYYPNIDIRMIVNYANIDEIFQCFKGKDQVMFIGHGGNKYISVGNERITESTFGEYFKNEEFIPSVLGVFSCNQIITDKNILSKIDYFITDDEVSFPSDVECFIFSYFRRYHKCKAIHEAFWAARIGPFLRTRGVPPYKLYERGEWMKDLSKSDYAL